MNGFMVANFQKDIAYSDTDGNYINDSHIKVNVEFDSGFDFSHKYMNEDNEFAFDGEKGSEFIERLLTTPLLPKRRISRNRKVKSAERAKKPQSVKNRLYQSL
jgi:hypothetical protein